MTTATQEEIFGIGRKGPVTRKEYSAIIEQADAARERGDFVEFRRLASQIPMVPWLMMAIKDIYGKDAVRELNFDLTQANAEYGEGWLDE